MSSLRRFFLPFVLIHCFFAATAIGQTTTDNCFEAKYLDLFGLASKDVHWSDSDINGLLTQVRNEPSNHKFLIPAIVKQLADYHPCRKKLEYNQERFLNLVGLYVGIRGEPIKFVWEYSFIDNHIEAIRKDFYDQVLNDKMLPSLIYTMDDGPLQGEIVSKFPTSKPISSAATPFGEIQFIAQASRLYAVAVNKSGKTLWARILKGTNPNRYLTRISPGPIAVDKYEAVVVVSPFVDGERLSMYVRPNGSFVFYTHSW